MLRSANTLATWSNLLAVGARVDDRPPLATACFLWLLWLLRLQLTCAACPEGLAALVWRRSSHWNPRYVRSIVLPVEGAFTPSAKSMCETCANPRRRQSSPVASI